jgi:hypothetical protein
MLHLNVVNTNRDHSITAQLRLSAGRVESARAFTIVDDPTVEVSELNSDSVMQIVERQLSPQKTWEFPAASVTALDVKLEA